MEEATIELVKTLKVSSLDRGLPEVTLEFFLKYEGEGAPIQWAMSDCEPPKKAVIADPEPDAGTCVKAHFNSKDNRSVTILVSVGAPKTRPGRVPRLFRVTITDQSGTTHSVDHLSDLPMELHRPLPKWPRDLPFPAGMESNLEDGTVKAELEVGRRTES